MPEPYSTDYFNAFLEVADDCPVDRAAVPPLSGGRKTAAALQYEALTAGPYSLTSDELLFRVHAVKNAVPDSALAAARAEFFRAPRACLRASPLPKRYGFGSHFDENGKIALVPIESGAYRAFAADPKLKHFKALRSAKKEKESGK